MMPWIWFVSLMQIVFSIVGAINTEEFKNSIPRSLSQVPIPAFIAPANVMYWVVFFLQYENQAVSTPVISSSSKANSIAFSIV